MRRKLAGIIIGTAVFSSLIFITASAQEWRQEGTAWRYADDSGAYKTGWQLINNKWYYFNQADAVMAAGWINVSGKWYFMDTVNGDMKTGWIQSGGKWYYLDTASGHMLANTTTPDGYYVDGSGAYRAAAPKPSGGSSSRGGSSSGGVLHRGEAHPQAGALHRGEAHPQAGALHREEAHPREEVHLQTAVLRQAEVRLHQETIPHQTGAQLHREIILQSMQARLYPAQHQI